MTFPFATGSRSSFDAATFGLLLGAPSPTCWIPLLGASRFAHMLMLFGHMSIASSWLDGSCYWQMESMRFQMLAIELRLSACCGLPFSRIQTLLSLSVRERPVSVMLRHTLRQFVLALDLHRSTQGT